jgi:RNA polymerase sigma factor (sigma-70 family)
VRPLGSLGPPSIGICRFRTQPHSRGEFLARRLEFAPLPTTVAVQCSRCSIKPFTFVQTMNSEQKFQAVRISAERLHVHDGDADAIHALRSRDVAGLKVLVGKYQVSALRLAYNVCGHQQIAEDAVADAFLSVLKHIDTYDESRPFETWFYRIVINCVRGTVRRNRRVPTVPDTRDLLQHHADPAPGPEVDLVQSELETALLRQVELLPEKQREAIVLRYYLDMDQATMSTLLGVPVGTVKWRLFQARKKLQRQITGGSEACSYLAEEVQQS